MFGLWRKFFDPRVSDHLIADEGEIVIDEVRRHPMAFVGPIAVMLGGLVVVLLAFVVPIQVALVPIIVGLVIMGLGGYRVLSAHMDRFVITNMRVFRVRGIFSQHTATMPMSRILDISVHKPLIGRIFSYGHFVFESAAQDQGLRDIRYVARPDERDLTIQRVIQRSGLRSSMRPLTEHDEDGTEHDEDGVDHDRRHRRRGRGRRARGSGDRRRQDPAGTEHRTDDLEQGHDGVDQSRDGDRVDFDLIEVDPTDGSSRIATAAEDAAWLAGGDPQKPAVDPVTGRVIPTSDVLARDAADAGSEPWTQAWSVRDRDEHRRAGQQVAESEVAGSDLRDWLPRAGRITLTEEENADGSRPSGRRRGETRDEQESDKHQELGSREVDDRPDSRS